MDRTLIIVAGMPATGKTTFANYLSDKMQVPLVPYHTILTKILDS